MINIHCYFYLLSGLNQQSPHDYTKKFINQTPLFIMLYVLWTIQNRVFANGPGDLGSIPGHIIPKTLKMVLDTSLLNTQHYKVCIKGKVEQSRERSSTLPYTSM